MNVEADPGHAGPGSDQPSHQPLSERFAARQQAWWARFGHTATGAVIKLVLLAAAVAVGIAMVWRMVEAGAPLWAPALTVAGTLALVALYLVPGRLPLKYLVPGVALLVLFQVFPFVYTFYISFTNYGLGQILTKEQAIEQIERASMTTPEGAPRFSATPMADNGAVGLLLVDPDGGELLGTADGLVPLDELEVSRDDDRVVAVDGYERVSLGVAQDRIDEYRELRVPLGEEEEDGEVRLVTLTQATVREPARVYDEDRDVIVDEAAGVTYVAGERGRFVDLDTGTSIAPGWRVYVGGENWRRAFMSAAIRDPFFGVLGWTYLFALLSTGTTFALGLGLALALNDDRVRGKKLWRALLIIPYALPTFLTALIWRGMMNRSFGVLNELTGLAVPWLTHPQMAKVSVILVNLWFGFPYMFLICTGALQSIPNDVYEAAEVDGAGGWSRLTRITLPLLLVSTAPVLLSTFAFNFNNFNVIYLVTGGNPPVAGAVTPVGHTDILISYTYRIAFESGGGQDYGLAAVIAMVTFAMVAVISLIAFRWIRPLEEIHQ